MKYIKNTLPFTLLLICIQVQAQTQGYTGQHNGYIHFYKPVALPDIFMVSTDSATLAGTDSVYWFRPERASANDSTVCDGDTVYCSVLRIGLTPMGLMVKAHDRYLQYQNVYGETITYDMHMAIGDSGLVYENSTEQIRIKLLSATATTSWGQPDSVLTFQYIHTDLAGIALTTPINGSNIVFSKAFGMLSGYAADSFPQVPEMISLEGIRGPNVGFHGLTYATANDFQVNEEFEIHSWNVGAGSFGVMVTNDFYHFRVLNRIDFPTHVIYNLRRDRKILLSGSYYYFTDTVGANFDQIWVDVSPAPGATGLITGHYYKKDSLLNCSGPFYAYTAKVDPCLKECETTGCVTWDYCNEATNYNQIDYMEHAGNTYKSWGVLTSPYVHNYSKLVYLKTNTIECGTAQLDSHIPNNNVPEYMPPNAFKVYPNPSNDKVTIESIMQTESILSVSMVDMTGKNITSISNVNSSLLLLDISHFVPGTYWLQIKTNASVYTEKLVVIR